MSDEWSTYVLPKKGPGSQVTNRSQQAILEFNKRQKIVYSSVKREIYITQLLGEAEEYDTSYSMLWTGQDGSDIETWSGSQYLIPASLKDDFFLQFVWRVPAIVYNFNPESALASGTNILLRDILGTNDPAIWNNFTDKYLGFVRGFQSRWFPYLLLACGTASSHPLLPMEIRVGSYLNIICCYLETMVAIKTEELPSFPMITEQTLHSVCLPLTSVGDAYLHPSAKTATLMQKQEKRSNQPGFWTDLLCHFRCIICGHFLELSQESEKGACPNGCLQEHNTTRCSLCNTVMVGEKQIILHYTTLCKRPVGESCPVCTGKALSGTCQCQLAMASVHRILKSVIESRGNALFKVPNIKLLSAIRYHHYAGNLSFSQLEAKDRNYAWWQVDRISKNDHKYTIKQEDVDAVLCMLPVLSNDQKSIKFPGTSKVVSVEQLLENPIGQIATSSKPPTSSQEEDADTRQHPTKVPSWLGGEDSEDSSITTPSLSWDNMKSNRGKNKQQNSRPPEKDGESGCENGDKKEKGENKRSESRREQKQRASRDKDGSDKNENNSSNEDDGPDETMFGTHPFKRRDQFKCRNETHLRPKLFRSSVEKLRHIISVHKCPFAPQGCKYYNEFEADMKMHVAEVHDEEAKIRCEVIKCSQKFTSKLLLTHHMSIHPKCGSCLEHFFDAQCLKNHHPCFNLQAENFSDRREKGGAHLSSVPINEVDLFREGNFDPNVQLADSMAQLTQLIPMEEATKRTLIENFRKCAALQVASQNLEKYPSSARKMTRLLIEPPNFLNSANQKENLGKVQDFLGKDLDIWSPSNSPKAQFRNFLSLAELNQRMVAAVAACKLYESSACCLLLQRFSITAKNAIESRVFSPQSTWSYTQILMTSQQIYFYLNLEEVAMEAEESRKKESEHLYEYASRAYKLLNTASLGREVEEKEKYIATNLKRLVFRALPPKVRSKVENLELRFGISYDSKDLLDFYKAEQLEQSHLRGDSLADTALIEPQKVLHLKKGKSRIGGDKSAEQVQKRPEAGPARPEHGKDQQGRGKRVRNVVNDTKLGAVGHLHPDKPVAPAVTPKPPFAVQGMAQGARDLFNQAARGSKAEYIRSKKSALGLDEDDRSIFCFKCGAAGDQYHSQNKCKLPNTDLVHNCGGNTRLFHKPNDCPKRSQPLRSIKIIRESY